MSSFDVLPTLCYVAGLINEIKKSKKCEIEVVQYHFFNILEQINKLIINSDENARTSFYLCKDKIHDIMLKYNNDSNYCLINDLEEIKVKLKAAMFSIH